MSFPPGRLSSLVCSLLSWIALLPSLSSIAKGIVAMTMHMTMSVFMMRAMEVDTHASMTNPTITTRSTNVAIVILPVRAVAVTAMFVAGSMMANMTMIMHEGMGQNKTTVLGTKTG